MTKTCLLADVGGYRFSPPSDREIRTFKIDDSPTSNLSFHEFFKLKKL